MKKKITLLFLLTLVAFASLSCRTNAGKFDKVMTAIAGTGYLKYYIRPTEMRSENYDKDRAYVKIDFSYQKENQNYVSDAYTNFSINYEHSDFVEASSFIIDNSDVMSNPNDEEKLSKKSPKIIELSNITTFDRDSGRGYIRIGTILKKDDVEEVLTQLSKKKAKLRVVFVSKEVLIFEASDDLVDSIKTAFQR